MAITWNGSTYLSGEAAQNGYDCPFDGPHFTFQEVVQEDQIVRGTKLSRIARGNAVREATFSVNRQHADRAAADTFANNHPAVFTGVQQVIWDGGANWNSCTVIAVTRAIGAMTITSYRVRGVPS